MESVLQKANIHCKYENIKSAIQTATNRWITSLIKGYPEDLSEFIENVVKREFNFDADATFALKNCNSIALINCPHANIKIGQLTLNGKLKKKENYVIEFWFNKTRVKYNPEDNFVSVFHKEKYGIEKNQEMSEERRHSISMPKVMSSMSSLDGGSKEFLEIAVLKRGKDRRSFGKPMFKKDRDSFKNELRDSFKGRLILPLSKAFQVNQKQHAWTLVMGGVNVGEIELTFDFTNQEMISAHEMFISQISNKVIDNFNELWKLHEPASSQRTEGLSSTLPNQETYIKQPPLTCHVEATQIASNITSVYSSSDHQSNEDEIDKIENTEERLEIRINNKIVESDKLVGDHFLIPVRSFKNDIISLTIPIVEEKL